MILLPMHYLVNRPVYDPHAHALSGQQARVLSSCPRITWSTDTCMILIFTHYLVNRHVYDPLPMHYLVNRHVYDPHIHALPGQ